MVAADRELDLETSALTRDNAGDPRTFARLAEAVCEGAVASGSKMDPLSAQRMMDVLQDVCLTLTRRELHQAERIEPDPVEAFRAAMKTGKKALRDVITAYFEIDRHWQVVETRFGDKRPVIPASANYFSPDEDASERILAKAAGYLDNIIELVNDMVAGRSDPLNARRKLDFINHACLLMTGQDLSDVADRWTNPLRRFRGALQTPPVELLELRDSYRHLEDVTDAEIAEWDTMIASALALQHQARHDPAKFMAYVFRDADPSRAGEVLELQWFHVSWFGIWIDPTHPHSLIMAPPRHGKSYCACAMDLWEVGNRPELRVLVLYDKGEDKVAKEILRIKRIMRSDEYRAIFPAIRILDRSEDEKDTQTAFTVGRKNRRFSREATFEGAGILGNINGDGFDRIRADDFSPPQCRDEPWNRKRYASRFTNVAEERLRDLQDCGIRMIHTPWHPEDAPGLIRKGCEGGNLPLWRCQVDAYAILDDANGDPIPLWPRKADVGYLKERRWRLGRDYDCCYRLIAGDPAQKPLSNVWFYNAEVRSQTTNDVALLDGLAAAHRTLSIDPAASDGRSACDTGVVDARLTPNGYGFIARVWFQHLAPMQLLEWIVTELVRAWQDEGHPYNDLLIEAAGPIKGMITTWEDLIPKELEARGMPKNVMPAILMPGTRVGQGQTGQNRSKLVRHREASPYYERGSVRFAGRRYRIRQDGDVGGEKWALGAVPNSDIERLVGTMRDFDGTTRFDAGDATNQWTLFHKSELQDPFRIAHPMAHKPKQELDPMEAAYHAQKLAMMEPPRQTEDITEDTAAIFSKYDRPSAGRHF